MNRNKKNILFWILIPVCAACACLSFFYMQYQPGKSIITPKHKTSANLVTLKDREPQVIPLEAIKNGRILTIPILMYHDVGDLPQKADKIKSDLTVSTADFEAEVKWLKNAGYTSINLEDIYLFSLGKFTTPKKPVVFTFDDGYQGALANAPQILKKYGYTGSFGIITQYPGTTAGNNTYATWAAVAQAYLAGNEIVSHTQTHFDGSNPKFTVNFILRNLSGSVTDIKNNLGLATNILIYPYGHYTTAYIAQAKKAGFVMGVTVHEGDVINLDDLMHIPRVRVHGAETLEEFKKIIETGNHNQN